LTKVIAFKLMVKFQGTYKFCISINIQYGK
jgi:hypothetical protein